MQNDPRADVNLHNKATDQCNIHQYAECLSPNKRACEASAKGTIVLTYCPMNLAHKAGSYVKESLLELKWLL